jgi:hypothetical protein
MATRQVPVTHLPGSEEEPIAERTTGSRRICGCQRRNWTKCPHPWQFGMASGKDAAGRPLFRFSLHRYMDKPGAYVMAKTEAESLRDDAREDPRRQDRPVRPPGDGRSGHAQS